MSPAEREADSYLARGDLVRAETLLETAAGTGSANAELWLKLASVRRAQGKAAAAMHAIDHGLSVAPLDFLLLMSRARLLESAGERAEAARFYLRALAQLPPGEAIPSQWITIVSHARQFGQAFSEEVSGRWHRISSDEPGLCEETRQRIARFTTNALRRTRPFHSEPTHYHYPGLVEHEFHPRSSFPWLAALEARTAIIRAEYLALLRGKDARAEPYVQYPRNAPVRQWETLNHSLDWTAFHLLRNAEPVAPNATACPATMAALASIDQPEIAARSPNAMFSVLKPRTRIPPHVGIANTRLVCHLPLIVPPGCRFRVGAETREWHEGEAFVFDDTIEHEAANDSDEPRVVFIFDIWHPGLQPEERRVVAKLMETGGLDEDPGL